MSPVLDDLPAYFEAFGYTVFLFLVSGVLSLLLGTLLAAMRVGPVAVLRVVGTLYVTLVRNTPLVIVFAFFSFVAPIFDIRFGWLDVHIGTFDFTDFFGAAVVSLALYTSAFVCEALRAGVNAVPLGQAEAARASIPPLASVQIALVKNTSVAAVFGVAEAVAQMRRFNNNFADDRYGIALAFVIGYVVIVEAVSFLSGRLERRYRVSTA